MLDTGYWMLDARCRLVGVAGGGGGLGGDAVDVGRIEFVAGVENAAEFVVVAEDGIGFVDQEGRTKFLDDAEERGGADVGGDYGAVNQLGQHREERGFTAALHGGLDANVRADVAQAVGVSVENPERKGFGGAGRENEEALDLVAEVIEECDARDGVGP